VGVWVWVCLQVRVCVCVCVHARVCAHARLCACVGGCKIAPSLGFLVNVTQDGGVRTEQLSSHGADFVKFDVWVFFENLSRKFKLH
jgi:hypothetical protein